MLLNISSTLDDHETDSQKNSRILVYTEFLVSALLEQLTLL